MAQVVTNENMVEFIQTGKVAEFKPPEKQEAPPTTEVNGKTDSNTELPPRDADGKFQSPSGEKSPPEKGKTATQPADDDPDSANLTEHARRVIGKKHRAMKEAEEFGAEEARRAIRAERRAAELEQQLSELSKGSSKSGQGPAAGEGFPEEPNPDDFKTVGEYTRALTKYEVAKAAKIAREAGKQHNEQSRQQAEADAIGAAFVERRAEFEKTHPDFEAVLEDSPLVIPDAGLQYIAESEIGPELAYFLAQPGNKETAERLSKLSPRRVIAELGKLEARLEEAAKAKAEPTKGTPPAQPARQVSRAPAPIQPLSGDAATPVQKDPSQMTFQELRAHRMAERKAGKYT